MTLASENILLLENSRFMEIIISNFHCIRTLSYLYINIFIYTDYKDFDDSVIYVEFPTDRDAVEVAVPIVDDDIDEADEQIFIIFLEVVNATNLDNLNFLENREISVGRIKDDESKYVDLTF